MRYMIMAMFLTIIPVNNATNNFIIMDDNVVLIQANLESYALPYFNQVVVDDEKIKNLTDKITKQIYIEPENAYIDENGVIIDEVPGIKLNREAFLISFYDYFYGDNSKRIQVPKVAVYPRVTSELLAEIYVENLSSFQTFYNEENKERSHNIKLSTEAIDNHVVFPGESFSFNKIVGERTIEKGYQKAPVIVKGELSEDIGGGICQVSSTLFNAVGLQGIQIMERYSHSRSVPYVAPGKDAAVSWWGPDFVFENKYEYPLLLKANAQNGMIEIKVYAAENKHK